jgi:ubiquinone/menaquinone biosynthesis C-methylase UbiE
MGMSEEKPRGLRWRRPPASLNPIRSLFASDHLIGPYATKGQVVADLGCALGYYTFALAKCVGPQGKVYAVDLDKKCIQAIEKKIESEGYHNIEARASSAADLGFIKDGSVDFVLANGLLCSMAGDRQGAVREIKRILRPGGRAYLALGFPPPLGFVNRAEWENILKGFRVERRGGYIQKWAVVKTM